MQSSIEQNLFDRPTISPEGGLKMPPIANSNNGLSQKSQMMPQIQGSQANGGEHDFGAKSVKILDRVERGNLKYQSADKSQPRTVQEVPDKSM